MNLEEIRRVTQQATPGPWRACGHDRGGCQCGLVWSQALDVPVAGAQTLEQLAEGGWSTSQEVVTANAEFIALAREAIPWLLNRIDQLVQAGDERDVLILSALRECECGGFGTYRPSCPGTHAEDCCGACEYEPCPWCAPILEALSSPAWFEARAASGAASYEARAGAELAGCERTETAPTARKPTRQADAR